VRQLARQRGQLAPALYLRLSQRFHHPLSQRFLLLARQPLNPYPELVGFQAPHWPRVRERRS